MAMIVLFAQANWKQIINLLETMTLLHNFYLDFNSVIINVEITHSIVYFGKISVYQEHNASKFSGSIEYWWHVHYQDTDID